MTKIRKKGVMTQWINRTILGYHLVLISLCLTLIFLALFGGLS